MNYHEDQNENERYTKRISGLSFNLFTNMAQQEGREIQFLKSREVRGQVSSPNFLLFPIQTRTLSGLRVNEGAEITNALLLVLWVVTPINIRTVNIKLYLLTPQQCETMKAFGNDNEQIITEASYVDVLRNTYILILNNKFRFFR